MSEKKVYVPVEATKFIEFDPKVCTGCPTLEEPRCVKACRMDMLIKNPEHGKPPLVIYSDECCDCGCCVHACPTRSAGRYKDELPHLGERPLEGQGDGQTLQDRYAESARRRTSARRAAAGTPRTRNRDVTTLDYVREPVLMPIWGWNTPAQNIPEQQVGDFRIIKRVAKAGTAWPMNGTLGYDYCVFMDDAPMTILQQRRGDRWRDWMVDSPIRLVRYGGVRHEDATGKSARRRARPHTRRPAPRPPQGHRQDQDSRAQRGGHQDGRPTPPKG